MSRTTDIDRLQIEIESKADSAFKGLKQLKDTLKSVDDLGKSKGLVKVCETLEKISSINFNNLAQLNGLGKNLGEVSKNVKNLTSSISEVPKTSGISNALTDITNTKEAMVDTSKKVNETRKSLDKTSSKFKLFGKEAQKSTKKARGGLMQLFKIVVLYGTAFRLWSMFTSGISEGLQNLSQYNEETSTAMSKLSTMSLQLKNSIASALYPVIVAMTPALQMMANAVIKALNAFNQFVAAMSGSKTYIRAKEYLKEYADTAKKTANQIKKSFAGMDEITVIGKQDSSSEDNPADMFEEVAIDNSVVDSVKEILRVVGLVGVGLAGWKIGTFLADLFTAGKKVETLKESIALLGKKLTLTAGVTLAITGITLETAGIVSAVQDGLNGLNFAEILGGGGSLVAGAALIGKFFSKTVLGSAIGAIVAGVPMYFTGLYDAIVNGLNWLNGVLIPVGSTLAGAGIGAIIGSLGGPIGTGIGALIGLIVGLLTDLVILVVENWDAIAAFFVEAWNAIAEFFVGIATWIWDNVFQPVIDFFTPFFEVVASVFQTIWSVVSTVFMAIYEVIAHIIGTVIDIFVGMGQAIWAVISKIYEIVSTIVQAIWAVFSWLFGMLWDFISSVASWVWDKALKPVVDFVSSVVSTIVEKFKSIVNIIKTKVIDPVLNFFKGMIDAVVGFFKNVGIKIVDSISGVFKSVMNGVFTLIEGFVNFFIKGLNGVIDIINLIPGVSIGKVDLLQIPRFATGGFPEDGLFMANHGELVGGFSNGRTAVANNEQIVEGIAGGVYAANQEQNELLREQNKLLRQLAERGNGQIDVTTIASAMQRKNRRDGKTIVPVGI